MDGIAYVDGTVTSLSEARVPLMDRGYLLGDGVFETMRVSNGIVFRRDDHTARLQHGLEVLGFKNHSAALYDDAVDALMKEGQGKIGGDLYLRVNVTNGLMDSVTAGTGVSVTGICKPFAPYSPDQYATGIHLVVAPQRKDVGDFLSSIKHLSYLPYIAARRFAVQRNAHDAMLLNTNGSVAEATTSNLFAFHDGVIFAPGKGEGALPGITRKVVLELVGDIGIPVETNLPVATLENSKEVFATNTTGGVVPVTKFEGKPVGDGKPGVVTNKLGKALDALVHGVGP